ncbi:hypothetical protein [Streptomyces sp. MAI_2237]
MIPPGALYACDNGKFGKGWPGEPAWFAWLTATVDRYGPDLRALGIPAALAAQDGSEHGLIPWDSIDVLFLAGSTDWKTSPPPTAWPLRPGSADWPSTWAASTPAGGCASRRPSAAPAATAPTSP